MEVTTCEYIPVTYEYIRVTNEYIQTHRVIYGLYTNTLVTYDHIGATDDGTRVINIEYRDIILGFSTGEMDLLN